MIPPLVVCATYATGEHARGPTKILKRDPSSEAASPHDYAAPSVPPSSSQAAPASRPLQGHPEGGRGADEPPRADPISAAGGANNRGMLPPSFSAAGQTPAGAAAAAAAHAAMAGPLNPPRPPAPKYNPPSHLPDQPPPQRHDKPPQQQQGVSSIDALASVGSHHSLKLSSSQQSLNQAQQRPQGGSGAAALSQADPSLPYPQGGGGPRPQMPVPEPRPLPQNELGGMGPHPTPSQQITAQAARHEPQRVQQNQAVGNGTQPSNTMQFGSMLHVPSQAKMDGSQSTPNPLQFGIPAGMLPGAGAEGRAQPVPAQGPPGHTLTHVCLLAPYLLEASVNAFPHQSWQHGHHALLLVRLHYICRMLVSARTYMPGQHGVQLHHSTELLNPELELDLVSELARQPRALAQRASKITACSFCFALHSHSILSLLSLCKPAALPVSNPR